MSNDQRIRRRTILRAAAITASFGTTPLTESIPVGRATAAPTQSSGESRSIVVEYVLERVSERPERIQVTATVSPTPETTAIDGDLPSDGDIEAVDGFDTASEGIRWDGKTDTPSVTYTAGIRRTDDSGRLITAGTPDWALFRWHDIEPRWSYRHRGDDVSLKERATLASDAAGYVGTTYAYLGRYETQQAGDVTLVVPESSTAVGVSDLYRQAGPGLRIGGRSPTVVFVAPDPIAVSGRAIRGVDGPGEAFVGAGSPIDSPDNAWIHEYVHTRQQYETTTEMAWFDDASAEYYAALEPLRQGYIEFDRFYEYVTTDRAADSVLIDSTEPRSHYFKGMRVLAALDTEIRIASDGARTLAAVVRQMNASDNPISRADFKQIVSSVVDASYDDWLDQYLTTSDVPRVPETPWAFTNPTVADSDADGLSDVAERRHGTNPFVVDTDDDGFTDAEEVRVGTDPTQQTGPGRFWLSALVNRLSRWFSGMFG
jgi:hypothetical protein